MATPTADGKAKVPRQMVTVASLWNWDVESPRAGAPGVCTGSGRVGRDAAFAGDVEHVMLSAGADSRCRRIVRQIVREMVRCEDGGRLAVSECSRPGAGAMSAWSAGTSAFVARLPVAAHGEKVKSDEQKRKPGDPLEQEPGGPPKTELGVAPTREDGLTAIIKWVPGEVIAVYTALALALRPAGEDQPLVGTRWY